MSKSTFPLHVSLILCHYVLGSLWVHLVLMHINTDRASPDQLATLDLPVLLEIE